MFKVQYMYIIVTTKKCAWTSLTLQCTLLRYWNGHPLIASYFELTTPSNNVNRYAPVDFSLSTNPYIWSILLPSPWLQRAYLVVPYRYIKVLFIAIQRSLPRFSIYLLIIPTSCVVCSSEHAIEYVKLPSAFPNLLFVMFSLKSHFNQHTPT